MIRSEKSSQEVQPEAKKKKRKKGGPDAAIVAPISLVTLNEHVLYRSIMPGVLLSDIFVARYRGELVIVVADNFKTTIDSQPIEWKRLCSIESLRKLFDAQGERFVERSAMNRWPVPEKSKSFVEKRFSIVLLPHSVQFKNERFSINLDNGVLTISLPIVANSIEDDN